MTIVMIWVLFVGGQPRTWHYSEFSCNAQKPPGAVCVAVPEGGEIAPAGSFKAR
jgi:hypothetical protein